MNLEEVYTQPLLIQPNRVWRPFKGGKMLDKWQGKRICEDLQYSEEWIGSVVEARNPTPKLDEGLSRVKLPNGTEALLKDLIMNEPNRMLGEQHVRRFGAHPSFLVKVLDSYDRLMIQVHPTPSFARTHFNSDYGKTEAWYILDARTIEGVQPYVYLGFKPGVTKEHWIALFEKQDIRGMEDALHKVLVKPGDLFYVPGGVPHAAGSGVTFLEIQEPTDLTIRTERISPSGVQVTDIQMHQGIGFEMMFDCFQYDNYDYAELLEQFMVQPNLVHQSTGGSYHSLLEAPRSPYFSLRQLDVAGQMKWAQQTFNIAIVLEGQGMMEWGLGKRKVKQSDTFFLPYGLKEVEWINHSERLKIAICGPSNS
jgi:mannose-6-phosphate isomerase